MAESKAEYMRRWREHPDKRQADAARNRATVRALWRLANLHRDEFERLQDAERLTEGLPPIHTVKRGRPALIDGQADG